MGTRMLQRRGTAAQWSLANPVLGAGELGIESDTGVVKSGDGVNNWRTLPAVLGSTYLPLLGKAADADKLDGLDSTAFLQKTEATATYLPLTTASSTYQSQSSIVSANTPLAPVRRDGVGNSSFNEVMLVGQTTAASAARKDYVDTTVTAATGQTSASRKTNTFWGAVTAFPTTGVLSGDTCLRTNIGTNGSFWTYTGNTSQGSGGWVVDTDIACTSTTRPTVSLYKGLKIYETDTGHTWAYSGTGTIWWPVSSMACFGKLWRSLAFSGNMSDRVQYAAILDKDRVAGGFTAQHDTSASAWNNAFGNSLTVPLDGFYRITTRCYATGGQAYDMNHWVGRNRAGVGDATILTNITYKASANDFQPTASDVLPLKASDRLSLQAMAYGTSAANYYGSTETMGSFLYAEWVSPLNGAAPV